MKKKLLLAASSIAILSVAAYATAQTTANFTTTNSNITVSNTQTQEPQLISIQIIQNSETGQTTAKLTEIQPDGAQLGLNRLMLNGTITETTLPNGTKDISVLWGEASIIDEKSGERKTTPLSMPFTSKATVQPNLEAGDPLKAEGDPIQLIAALQRLLEENQTLNENEEKEEEEKEKDTTPDRGAVNDSGAGASDDDNRKFTSPEFKASNDTLPTITTESCNVRVDMAQKAAIEQERTLVDGVEETACADTLTRYPIEAKSGSCPLTFDTSPNVMKAHEQVVYVYTNPNSGEIEVQGCTADTESAIALVETTEGCGIQHDFANNISYQQSRITYEHQGVVQTLQDCLNTETTYTHVVTQDGCEPINANGEVTFQEQTTINVNGTIQTILACQPNPETTVAVLEEDCTTQRYTHDFQNNQSYLNKNYYYMNGETRVDVSNCIATSKTYNHLQDETVCSAINNDTTRQTTMYARTYIEDSGKNYISACEAISPAIPYVETGAIWNVHSSNQANLNVTHADSHPYNDSLQNSSLFKSVYIKHAKGTMTLKNDLVLSGETHRRAYDSFTRGHCLIHDLDIPCKKWFTYPTTFTGAKYCLDNKLSGDWVVGGININESKSTETPQWTSSVNGNPMTFIGKKGSYNYYKHPNKGSGFHLTFNCTPPTCLHTELRANPTYLRGDNSSFTDLSTTVEVMHVCGDGSNLDGQPK